MNHSIKVIVKTFNIIEILYQSEKLTLKEITRRIKLPKPTVYRILSTLQSIGYVEYDADTQTHALSHKFVMLAKNYISHNSLVNVAIPYMRRLWETFGETVNLAKLMDREAVYIRIEESRHPFHFVDQIGDQASLHSTAIGKAIAAFLPEERLNEIFTDYPFRAFTKKTITNFNSLKRELANIRQLGYAIDDEEGHEGVICIGVPVFNKENFPCAAMSISMPKIRSSRKIIQDLCQQLPKVGLQISFELGVSDIRKCLNRE